MEMAYIVVLLLLPAYAFPQYAPVISIAIHLY